MARVVLLESAVGSHESVEVAHQVSLYPTENAWDHGFAQGRVVTRRKVQCRGDGRPLLCAEVTEGGCAGMAFSLEDIQLDACREQHHAGDKRVLWDSDFFGAEGCLLA